MSRIIFATHNQHKQREIAALLPPNLELVSLTDVGLNEDIPETGVTLVENARLKANYVFARYGESCFADDTGLEVQALGGEPGIFSARYAGPERDEQKNIDKLLSGLSAFEDRTARFKTVICFLDNSGSEHLFTGVIEGRITKEAAGRNGFGYDPVFQPVGYQETFAQMSPVEKNMISHRSIAFARLLTYLEEYAKAK